MERPVGLLSENHSVLAIALRIRLHEDNQRQSKVQILFLLIEIVPSVSFNPRTNENGRMSDKVFPMIKWVGLYKYIWLQRIYSLSITSRIFVQTQLVINGSDNVAFKVIVLSMNGKYS